MTKEEIKKALECCTSGIDCCNICPNCNGAAQRCEEDVCILALALITEQDAEIERLKNENEKVYKEGNGLLKENSDLLVLLHNQKIRQAKIEVLEELTTRLREYIWRKNMPTEVFKQIKDKLIKETKGGMRQIKFRGQTLKRSPENGTLYEDWVYGDLLHDKKFSKAYITIHTDDNDILPYAVALETVGQLTGLTDKNGVEIYEGDIVEFESHGYGSYKEKGIVTFEDGCYGISYLREFCRDEGRSFHRIGESHEWQDMGASGTVTYTYEVIGNIHDNPELLEEEE